MLDGEADLVTQRDSDEPQATRVTRGDFAYYPAGFKHTIAAVGKEPARYLMFKWHNAKNRGGRRSPLDAGIYKYSPLPADGTAGIKMAEVVEGPTNYLQKLHFHRTTVVHPGGYAAHVDAYDVALIVIEGRIGTIGEEVEKDNVVYFAAGQPHDMRSLGDGRAEYLVIEFHPVEHPLVYGWKAVRRRARAVVSRLIRKSGAVRLLRKLGLR